jgi:hypothetical protein
MITREQFFQQRAAFRGLLKAARIERRVTAALETPLNVKVSLAVSDVIKDRHSLFADRNDGFPDPKRNPDYCSLPTTISGASGCFMPTM